MSSSEQDVSLENAYSRLQNVGFVDYDHKSPPKGLCYGHVTHLSS